MKHFDISTIAASLAPKKQLILNAVDEMNEIIINEDKLHRLYKFTSEVYSVLNNNDNLQIICDSNNSSEHISKHIMDFLNMKINIT